MLEARAISIRPVAYCQETLYYITNNRATRNVRPKENHHC